MRSSFTRSLSRYGLALALVTGLYFTYSYYYRTDAPTIEPKIAEAFRELRGPGNGVIMDPDLAGLPAKEKDLLWALKDPVSGVIPANADARALHYTAQIVATHRSASLFDWVEAGPDSLGGRALNVSVDISDPSIILAGTASGGVWKSTDSGATWRITTQPNQQFSATTLAQDPRPSHTDTWYMAGGEFRGTAGSQLNISAGNYGLGVYKSIDNGDSWVLLDGAQAGSPTSFDTAFDYVSKMVVNPTTGTVFLANNASGIYRSDDGGLSFPRVLGTTGQHSYNDIDVASDGTLMAVLSTLTLNGTQNAQGGVYISRDDGVTWVNITPATFPSSHERSKVAIAPSNPSVAYVLTNAGRITPGSLAENIYFHKLNLTNGTSEDLSDNLPNYAGLISEGSQLTTLRNFTMLLAVKPDDEDFVILGGTVPYRSTNGFATAISTYAQASIGGYECSDSNCFDFVYATHYTNHWNDQHTVSFDPGNPNQMWSANDGGIYFTEDVTAPNVAWKNKNSGLNVAQFFGVAISDNAGDARILGGLQDHGVQYVEALAETPRSLSDFSAGTRSAFSDGGHVYFGSKHAFIGLANGRLHRLRYKNADGDIENFFDYAKIFLALPSDLRPPGASGFKFYIHPYLLDPVDDQTIFYPDGSTPSFGATLWRNPDINTGVSAQVIQRWERLTNYALPGGYLYTALTMSHQPAHVLYMGASASFATPAVPKIFRAENANTSTSAPEEISIPGVPAGSFVHNIAVNPKDANEILVVLSNFNIIGLYHSNDGGQTYTAVEGNLEGINGEGPSLRAAGILPLNDVGSVQRVYFVATSTGLFSTRELNGMNTVWEQEGTDLIGGVVIDDVVSRPSDGRVVVGSHGRGLVVGTPRAMAVNTQNLGEVFSTSLDQNYPNPFNQSTTIPFSLSASGSVELAIFDITGRLVRKLIDGAHKPAGLHQYVFDAGNLASGSYLIRIEAYSEISKIPFFRKTRQMTIL